jgi:hypothetical protein
MVSMAMMQPPKPIKPISGRIQVISPALRHKRVTAEICFPCQENPSDSAMRLSRKIAAVSRLSSEVQNKAGGNSVMSHAAGLALLGQLNDLHVMPKTMGTIPIMIAQRTRPNSGACPKKW